MQGVARATVQMNRRMQEREQRELEREQLQRDQERRREVIERERREMRRSSGWREWQEAIPGPWCSCHLEEVTNMFFFSFFPSKLTSKLSFLAPARGKLKWLKRPTTAFGKRKNYNLKNEKERTHEQIKLLLILFSKLQLLQFCPLPIITSFHTPYEIS